MVNAGGMDRQAVHEDYERARRTFHQLLDAASEADLARPTRGTKWNNEQLLWHMLFGYMVVRRLLVLGRVFARLPRRVSKAFARLLSASALPFDWVNYMGPRGAVKIYGPRRMGAAFDRVIGSLHRRLEAASEVDLARGMHYPVRWDPFFQEFMTLADVYRYPTQHLDFHYGQLPLDGGS
ncbi:DinB family protein [Streptomyces sp. ISL-96]|uniref:DinB family protein n=1 Tax=Streptomyces sp. ISL-96 TaxID=2819191 RepID=UPI001BED25A2|nr:DinB family protein [Streptomyces sp. ISL-96]MBT2490694.1 DinB family protein [Streptomyces sp. ISL-96]